MCTLFPRPEETRADDVESASEGNDINEKDDEKDDKSSDDGISEPDDGGVDTDVLEQISDNTSDESTPADAGDIGPRKRKRPRRLRMSDTLVTVIVGLWVVRYPIMNVVVQRCVFLIISKTSAHLSLVEDIDIPYIDFVRSNLLPEDMRKKMNHDVQVALGPKVG